MAAGLRERKKERTRLALETAALELFDAQGYDVTTVEQIAERADVSTRTFFRYYPTKADVLLNDQAGRLAMIRELLAERPADESIMASLRAFMTAIAVELPSERHLLAAQARWWNESDLLLSAVRNHHAQIVDLLVEFVSARLDRPDPFSSGARAIASACVASLVGVTTEWITPGGSETIDIEAGIASLESAIHVPS
jgi:AcrR family transcriptional regulator